MFDFDWLAILLLAALAFPVIAIVALVMTISLRDLVHRLAQDWGSSNANSHIE